MNLKSLIKRTIELTGYTFKKVHRDAYDQDGLCSLHNHEFMLDPAFQRSYGRGVQAAGDYHWQWRVHIGLWAASSASKLEGDFVECGVNRGFLSSAIMSHLNWDSLNKTFYLLDTFHGLDQRYVSPEEIREGALDLSQSQLNDGSYVSGVEAVRSNFSEWKNVRIIEGSVPETLSKVDAAKIAYLHLDMNCSAPEVAAAEFFWERLVPGAFILMDDYAYIGYRNSKLGMDGFAAGKGLQIASLPTGQGLLIKAG